MHPPPPAPGDSPFSSPRMRQWPSTARRRPCPLHSAYNPHRSQTALQIRPAAAHARPARAAPCRFHPQPGRSAALIPAAAAPARCGSAAAECATGSPAHKRPHWRGAACPCKYPAPCAPCRGAWIPSGHFAPVHAQSARPPARCRARCPAPARSFPSAAFASLHRLAFNVPSSCRCGAYPAFPPPY